MYKKLKNKKILIFGNTGFVGSWLSIALDLLEVKILGVSLKMNNQNYISNTPQFKKKIKTVYCDINNLDKIKNTIINFKPEIIIHLASQPIVQKGFKNPKKTFSTNIFGSIKIFEIIRKISSVKKIIVFTSDKVYRNDFKILNEKSNLGGLDPYSASKSCQDIISQSYNHSFLNKRMVLIRSGNIIGGGDWGQNRLLPDIIKAFRNNQKIKIRSINSTRPWLHVLDVINAFLIIINKNIKKNSTLTYNLAPNQTSQVTVGKILNIIKTKTQINNLKIKKIKSKIKEKKYLKLSAKKIFKELRWRPKLNLTKGLIMTIDLYLQKKESLFYKTKNQIINFLN